MQFRYNFIFIYYQAKFSYFPLSLPARPCPANSKYTNQKKKKEKLFANLKKRIFFIPLPPCKNAMLNKYSPPIEEKKSFRSPRDKPLDGRREKPPPKTPEQKK